MNLEKPTVQESISVEVTKQRLLSNLRDLNARLGESLRMLRQMEDRIERLGSSQGGCERSHDD